jgi:hypothetical protein
MAIYLAFIGKQYYNKARFIQEGLKYGVQRLAPFNLVYKLYLTKSIVYYAFFNDKYNVAQVFAKGKVNGVASTDPYVKKLLEREGSVSYVYESRGCGSCYSAKYVLDDQDIIRILNAVKERMKNNTHSYRWFYLSDIQEYDTNVDNLISYKVKKRMIEVSDIHFTRNLVKLNGIDTYVIHDSKQGIVKSIVKHRLKGKDIDDIRYDSKPIVDLSKYTNLDRWLKC